MAWHRWVIQNLKKKVTRGVKIDISNLVNFNPSSQKSDNSHFDEIHLPKA